MKLMTSALRIFLVAAFVTWSTSASAQTEDTGTATGAIGQTNIQISEEADTSAFDSIDRGSGVGGSATTAVGGVAGGDNTNQGVFGGGGGGGFGGLGALNSLFGGGGGFGGAGSTQPVIRTRLRSAIEVDPISPQRVQFTAKKRLVQIPKRRGLQNVDVTMVGRTAVISGSVTSNRDRRMSELLMRLEPGVSSVQNNVIVSPVNQ